MTEETAGGSAHLETFLERGILRNTRTFSSVFDRIFEKYEREFPEDETGGKVIDFYGENSEKQIESIFGGENACLGSRYRPILIVDNNNSSESDPEDAALSALIHERVLQVKQEIDWDQEEQKLREKRREKELRLQDSSSDDSDSAEYAEVRWHRKRNGRGKWAWPAPSLSSVGRTLASDSRNLGGGPRQLVMIDPSSQIVTTVSSQSVESSEDPIDLNDTIAYSQNNNSYSQHHSQLLSSMLDTTSLETDAPESTDTMSDMPLDVSVQNHKPIKIQNNQSSHRPEPTSTPVKDIVLAGSPTCGSSSSCKRDGNFLLSVNLKTATSVCGPMLELPDDATSTMLWSKQPSNVSSSSESSSEATPTDGRQHLPTKVEPFNIVASIKIESQSSTEEELLSGVASEAEDSQRFSTRRPYSSSQLSTSVTELGNDRNDTVEVKSQSESELETLPRPSRVRLEDERSEESLLSGYESGYVCETDTRTETNAPHVSALPSSRSGSTSSTPPPSDDIMTPPSSPENQKIATFVQNIVKMKPLQLSLTAVPVRNRPQGEYVPERHIMTTDPLTRTPTTETQAVEPGVSGLNGTTSALSASNVGATERPAYIEIVKQEREVHQEQNVHLPLATKVSMVESRLVVKTEFVRGDHDHLCQKNDSVIRKEVKTELARDSEELRQQTGINPYPIANASSSKFNDATARDALKQSCTHLVPSTEPSIPNDSMAKGDEIAQHFNPHPSGVQSDQTTSATSLSVTTIKATPEARNTEGPQIDQQPTLQHNPARSCVTTSTSGDSTAINSEIGQGKTVSEQIIQQQPGTCTCRLRSPTDGAPSSNSCTLSTVQLQQQYVQHHYPPSSPSMTDETMTRCRCCPRPQSTGSGSGACACSHTHSPVSPLTSHLSCTCTHIHDHCHDYLQAVSPIIPQIGHVSPPHGGNHTHFELCCSSHILNANATPSTQVQATHLTHSIPSPCTNHCNCCSSLRSPEHRNNLTSHLSMPSPQQMPLNFKRSRDRESDDKELSLSSSGSEIDSPPAKRHRL